VLPCCDNRDVIDPVRRLTNAKPSPGLVVLRRGSWFLLHVVVVTLLVFAATGRSSRDHEVPLFVNSSPIYPGPRAWQLVEKIGRGGDPDRAAAAELLQLGGAALPHILPKLDSLQPAARKEVLSALAPLALRMQLTTVAPQPEESEALWLSFWNDHFVDFHPAMARRVVRRFVQGPTAQRAHEVRRLDTFALDVLVRELIRLARERAEPSTVKHVVDLSCSIATSPHAPCPAVGPNTPNEVRPLVEQWRTWWLREHHRFESPSGMERFLAPILQTEYAAWVRTSTRAILTGRAFVGLPWRRFWFTSVQFGGAITSAWLVMRSAERLHLSRGSRASTWFTVPLCLTFSVPIVLLAAGCNSGGILASGGVGVLAGAGTGLWAVLYRRVALSHWSIGHGIYVHINWLLGVILASEHLCQVDGLGATLVTAVRAGDLQVAIWTAISCAVLITLGHAFLGRLARRPRTQGAVS
jgi:hypothetical protein